MDGKGASEALQEELLKAKYGGLAPPKKHLLQRRGEEGEGHSRGKQFFDSGTYNMEKQMGGASFGDGGEEQSTSSSLHSVTNGSGAAQMAPAHLRVQDFKSNVDSSQLRPSRMGGSNVGGGREGNQ